DEFDVMEVALAAVKLAHEAAGGGGDEEEIPEVAPPAAREPRGRGKGIGAGRGRTPAGGMVRLYVGLGRSAGIRPQDLVGAIAGESRLRGGDIGAIEISDRFSLVEVPDDAAGEVIAALRGSSIKGRKAAVRRER
ncbi:MAG: DbpA RNA binding domain-containing protein, partial [Pseudonocardiaceae bacterium]